MKVVTILCAFLALAAAIPADRKLSSDDSFERFFSSIFGSMEDDSPTAVADDAEDESSIFFPAYNFGGLFHMPEMPDFSSMFRGFFADPTSDPDTKVTNATSHTEMVNGHKVTINETVFETAQGAILVQRVLTITDDDQVLDSDHGEKPKVPDSDVASELPKKKKMEDNEVVEPVRPHEGDGSELIA